MGSNGIFRENKIEKNPCQKLSLLVQIGGEIYEHLYVLMTPYKSFKKLAWIEAFSIQAYFRRI